jgi:uncharacterized protein YabN with tetrapyrrole methylase and pyrophosphatase domain
MNTTKLKKPKKQKQKLRFLKPEKVKSAGLKNPKSVKSTPKMAKLKLSATSLKKFNQLVEQVHSPLEPCRGCPWHLDQSPSSSSPCILQEAFKLVDTNQNQPKLFPQSKTENRKLGKLSFSEFFGTTDSFLPSLTAAYKIGKKSEALQFDWSSWQEVLAKIEEEFAELKEELKSLSAQKNKKKIKSLSRERIFEELGDCLFTLAQLARHLNLNPEICLREANRKFLERLRKCVGNLKISQFSRLPSAQKEKLWARAKKSKS